MSLGIRILAAAVLIGALLAAELLRGGWHAWYDVTEVEENRRLNAINSSLVAAARLGARNLPALGVRVVGRSGGALKLAFQFATPCSGRLLRRR